MALSNWLVLIKITQRQTELHKLEIAYYACRLPYQVCTYVAKTVNVGKKIPLQVMSLVFGMMKINELRYIVSNTLM